MPRNNPFLSLFGMASMLAPSALNPESSDPLSPPTVFMCECEGFFDGKTCLHCGREYENTNSLQEYSILTTPGELLTPIKKESTLIPNIPRVVSTYNGLKE